MGTLAAEKRREAHSSCMPQPTTVSPPSAAQRAPRATTTTALPTPATSAPSTPSAMALAAADGFTPVAKSRLTLERVIGITSLSNAMMAVNPVTGEIAYSAGCIVVIYNLRRNKQVRYYRVEKTVSCLCFSPSGQYLAIGEKGYLPAITIWDGTDGTLCTELQLHKFGIACMAFSRDGRYLLSVGLVHDQHMYAWDLRKDSGGGADAMTGKAIGAAQIQEKILAMDYCQEGNFFVTVGEKHFKFWFLDDHDDFLATGYQINGIPEIQHRDAVMSAKSEATFTSVACGYGSCRLKTFAVTSDGTLCCFGASCIMERLVSLEASRGNAISVTEAYVAVAGSSSIVRLFDPSTLEYRSTMPFPPPFGKANEPNEVCSNILHPDEPHRYPAVIAVRVTGSHVIVLYSDRSLFIYDVSDTQNVQVERSFMCHSGCIRDLKIAGRARGLNAKGKLLYHGDEGRRPSAKSDVVPNGTFVTCSDDNTMRLWHLELHKQAKSNSRFSGNDGPADVTDFPSWKNPFSQEMLRVVYHDHESDFADEEGIVLGGTCSCDEVADVHPPSKDHGPVNGLRAIAIHPDQTQVVAGDKEGNITILQLPSLDEVREIDAHNTEVHCIAFSGIESDSNQSGFTSSKTCLMASGGRDRLVHVYDCNKEHNILSTLDNHSGAVTSLQFTRDGKKLLSCGADKNIVFSEVSSDGEVSRYNSVPFTGGKIFDMAITSDDEFLITSCNNRLDVHDISSCKHIKSHHVGEQHRIDVCPANFCVAMSGSLSDKTIHVVDIATGETLADATGHGEAITAVKFTPDCRRLVSASSDGCIFVWRLSEEIQNAIKSRLPRVTEFQAPNPVPPALAKVEPVQQEVILPPPAPPIPAPKAVRTPQQANPVKPRSPAQDLHISKAAPSSKKLSDNHVETTVTTPSAHAHPKKSDAKESKGWKSKAAPAPGPMAKIPMENWMRTREGAKKTVHVTDDDDFHAQAAEEGIQLAIDRSQTPDWAKTVKPSETKKAARKSPSRVDSRRQAGDKWGKRAAPLPFQRESLDDVGSLHDSSLSDGRAMDDDDEDSDENETDDPLYIKQQSGEVHQLDIPRSKEIPASNDLPGSARRKSASATDNVMNLSVGNLTSLSANLASSSLALEREQLEKRKKQIETANAVAAMNSKLIQLGLLKPQKPQQENTNEDDKSSEILEQDDQPATVDDTGVAPVQHEEMAQENTGGDTHISVDETAIKNGSMKLKSFNRADIPEEMLQSIDVSVIRGIESTHEDQQTDRFGKKGQHVVEEEKESKLDIRAPAVADSIPNFQAVNQSMSAFTQGFAVKKFEQGVAESTTALKIIGEVDQSLSAFSSGYADNSDSKKPEVSRSISVASSLSVFISGYGEDGRSHEPSHPRVDESLSSFTSGFQIASVGNQQSNSRQSIDVTTGVGASISSFTSGYTNTSCLEGSAVNQSISLTSVSASLSNFTSGYNTDERSKAQALPDSSRGSTGRQSVEGNIVAASLSTFTSGYESVPGVQQIASPLERSGDIGVAESLSVFTAGYEAANQRESLRSNEFNGLQKVAAGPLEQKRGMSNNGFSSANTTEVNQSLSSFTAGYELESKTPPTPSDSAPATESADITQPTADAGSPEATVLSTISDLDQQLVTVSKTFEELLPIEKATGFPATSKASIVCLALGGQSNTSRIIVSCQVGGRMADVVEKKLDMSLDQIADERKQEQRHQNNSNSHDSSGNGSGSGNGGSFRSRDRSPSPIGSGGNGGSGGKAKNARRADRIAHSAPYQSRAPRFNYNTNKGNQQRFETRPLIEPGSWTDKRVYVGNLSWNVTWQMLKDHMRQVGDEVVNVDILESGGRSKGCAIVTFRHPYAALKAVMQLNDTELDGRKIFLRKDREDVRQPPRINSGCRVYVGNLSWNVKWQELKDHMKKAGNVVHADVLEEPNGRSKGCGLVEYATPQEAQEAIHLLTNTELEGRLIFVREDREPEGGSISMIKNRALGRNGNGNGGGNGGQFVPHNMPYYPPPPVHHPHHHQPQYPPPPLHHQFQHMSQYPPAGVGGVDGRQIYIGNLPWDTHWESLRELFQTIGDVERAEIPQYPDGRSRGFGIVRFFNAQDAWQAIERYDQAEVNGRVIEVRLDRRGL